MYWLILNNKDKIIINFYEINNNNFQAVGIYDGTEEISPINIIQNIINLGLKNIQIVDLNNNQLVNTDFYNNFNNFFISVVSGSDNQLNFSFIIQ